MHSELNDLMTEHNLAIEILLVHYYRTILGVLAGIVLHVGTSRPDFDTRSDSMI